MATTAEAPAADDATEPADIDATPIESGETQAFPSDFDEGPEITKSCDSVIPEKKPGAEPLTPEELIAYDAATVVLVREAEVIAAGAESVYLDSKEQAASDKKFFEAKVEDLRKLIRTRAEDRGKRPVPPTPTLLDVLPKWRDLPAHTLQTLFDGASDVVATAVNAGVLTLGELYEQVSIDAPPPFGWSVELAATVRGEIEKIINVESESMAAAQPAESDLYKSYPLDRWVRFGLTAKDVEKLHAGETKGTASSIGPISTMGDLQRFITPNPNSPGYSQNVKDIKGMGDKGAERMSDAEMAFWGWWRAGGEAEFASEMSGTSMPSVCLKCGEYVSAKDTYCDECAAEVTRGAKPATEIPEPSTNGKHTTTDAPKTPSGRPSKRGASKAKGGKR